MRSGGFAPRTSARYGSHSDTGADHRHLVLPHHVQQKLRGARPVEATVAQHDSLRRLDRHGFLHVPHRRDRPRGRPNGPGVERIGFGLHRAAGTPVHALGALRDDPAGACPRRGRQQVVGAPGPELVRGGEHPVDVAQAPHVRQCGHLMNDHLRRGGSHRRDHPVAI
jgi:hypothetical protein